MFIILCCLSMPCFPIFSMQSRHNNTIQQPPSFALPFISLTFEHYIFLVFPLPLYLSALFVSFSLCLSSLRAYLAIAISRTCPLSHTSLPPYRTLYFYAIPTLYAIRHHRNILFPRYAPSISIPYLYSALVFYIFSPYHTILLYAISLRPLFIISIPYASPII